VSQTKTQLIDGIVVDAIGNVNIDSNTFYVDAANNRVGLGTSIPGAKLQVDAPSTGRSYTSSVLDFSNIHLEGITAGTTTSALTFSSGGGGGAAIAFSRGGSFQTEMSFWTCSTATTNSATERMRLDSSGRLGIGTTAPAAKFEVSTASGTEARITSTIDNNADLTFYTNSVLRGIVEGNSAGMLFGTTGALPTVFITNNTERARIDSSGRLLVGTSSAQGSSVLQLQTSGGAVVRIARDLPPGSLGSGNFIGGIDFTDNAGNNYSRIFAEVDGTVGSGDYPGRLVFSTTADGASSPTERMRISQTGIISGTSHNNLGVVGNGGVFAGVNNNASASGVGCFVSNLGSTAGTANNTNCFHYMGLTQGIGYYYLYGNGTSSFTSDVRKKKNIESTRDGYLEDLSKLRVVKYNWLNQSDGDPKELGLIAQEVEEVFPGLVQEGGRLEGDDFNCKVLKHSVLPYMLLKALQESKQRIEALEAKVAALEGV